MCNAGMHDATRPALDNAAHELRSLTGIVLQGAQLLATHPEMSADVQGIAVDIRQSGLLLAWFMDRAIECARVEQGRRADLREIALHDLLTQALRRAARSGQLVTQPPELPSPAAVCVDARRAERVIADVLIMCSTTCNDAVGFDARATRSGWEILVEGNAAARTDPIARAVFGMTQVLAQDSGVELSIEATHVRIALTS